MTSALANSILSQRPVLTTAVRAVRAANVSKRRCRNLKKSWSYGVREIFAELTLSRRANVVLREFEFWALDEVSFELAHGESLALIGPNGAGKTTLLKLISGLIRPDLGRIEVRGKVVSLMALGAGFRQVLSGRENIYSNMALQGATVKAIAGCFDEIVEFADLGDAIDAPVQTYSSGMFLRLAFACATHTNPDIFLIDELLAVGDYQFQGKCLRKLAQMKERGTSFIIASHYLEMLAPFCERALYLDGGKVIAQGPSPQVFELYQPGGD